VFGWQLADFALQLATLYLMLVAFGFATVTLVSVVLIRTAQRLTVSMPGFLETGSQQAMIVAILSAGGFPAGQALGFGSKVTLSELTIATYVVGKGKPLVIAEAGAVGCGGSWRSPATSTDTSKDVPSSPPSTGLPSYFSSRSGSP